jgi:hypothetical protein
MLHSITIYNREFDSREIEQLVLQVLGSTAAVDLKMKTDRNTKLN